VLTLDLLGPSANLGGVRATLSSSKSGIRWWSKDFVNDGLGKPTRCGTPPSPALLRACESEFEDFLASPVGVGAVRFIAPGGGDVCKWVTKIFKHGALIGSAQEVRVAASDMTAQLGPALRCTTSGRPDSRIKHLQVVLNWEGGPHKGLRGMYLVTLGIQHEGDTTGELSTQGAALGMEPKEFFVHHRLPRLAALALVPRALMQQQGTGMGTQAWEMQDDDKNFQSTIKTACDRRGGDAGGAVSGAAATAARDHFDAAGPAAEAAAKAALAPALALARQQQQQQQQEAKGKKTKRSKAGGGGGGSSSSSGGDSTTLALPFLPKQHHHAALLGQRSDAGACSVCVFARAPAPARPRLATATPVTRQARRHLAARGGSVAALWSALSRTHTHTHTHTSLAHAGAYNSKPFHVHHTRPCHCHCAASATPNQRRQQRVCGVLLRALGLYSLTHTHTHTHAHTQVLLHTLTQLGLS
jgi:hypothetical protein